MGFLMERLHVSVHAKAVGTNAAHSKTLRLHRGSPEAITSLEQPRLVVRPRVIWGALLLIGAVLALLDLLTAALYSTFGSEQVRRIFDVDDERSIPTWFSTLQLFVACQLLVVIAWVQATRRDRFAGMWWLLGAIFALLSMDEIAGIHEDSTLLTGAIGIRGPWVIGGAALVAVLGLLFIPFLRALPSTIARLFLLGAVIAMGGAIGVELLDTGSASHSHEFSWSGTFVTAIEEFLERTGFAIFVYALLIHIRDVIGLGALQLSKGKPEAEYHDTAAN